MSQNRNLRDALRSLVPNWLADFPGFNVGFAFLFSIALIADIFLEVCLQGLRAAWPGRGTPTALPLVGQGRGLIRGFTETDTAYATRLQAWLDLWHEAGSAETLVILIQTYLGNNLVVRAVDRAGNFVTANADGTISVVKDPTWNWDGITNPNRGGWWSDIWIIIYLTDGRWPEYVGNLGGGDWHSAWGTYGDSKGFGMAISQAAVDDIKSIISVFKGAHTFVQAVLLTTNPALLIPGALAGFPDGRYGNFGKIRTGGYIPARIEPNVRYLIPNRGG